MGIEKEWKTPPRVQSLDLWKNGGWCLVSTFHVEMLMEYQE
jgi:hypothetical protein